MNKIIRNIKNFTEKISKDRVSAYAAQSSFFIVVCFFPTIILLLTIIQYTPVSRQLFLDLLLAAAPDTLAPLIETFVVDVYSRPSIALISTSAVTTLWICGKTFLGITQGLDTIYGENTGRNYILRRILASFYTFIFIILLVICMILLVFGSVLIASLENVLPVFVQIFTALITHKFLIITCFLTLVFMLLYKYVPNRHNSFMRVFPGAIFAAMFWQLFSYIYSIYVEKSAGFHVMYGRLSLIVFAMLWLYFCITIFFYGAILNVMLFNKSE